MVVRANLIFQKRVPAKFETGPCEIRKDALKTTGRFWQKCHTGSFSHSRLLREARMLHYVPTSRSARIVVKPLHESPGPTTVTGPHKPGGPTMVAEFRGPSPHDLGTAELATARVVDESIEVTLHLLDDWHRPMGRIIQVRMTPAVARSLAERLTAAAEAQP